MNAPTRTVMSHSDTTALCGAYRHRPGRNSVLARERSRRRIPCTKCQPRLGSTEIPGKASCKKRTGNDRGLTWISEGIRPSLVDSPQQTLICNSKFTMEHWRYIPDKFRQCIDKFESHGYKRKRDSPLTRRWHSWIVAALCAVLLALSQPGAAFNLDTERAILHRNDDIGSMFGFTVAQYQDNFGPWLIVGAPEANTGQPNVVRPGAVYKCAVRNGTNECRQLPFDRGGNEYHRNPRDGSDHQISNKSMQWFGASLSCSSERGYIAACAPRYVYFTTDYKKREPIGTCFVMGERENTTKYQPCKSGLWSYDRQGFCQAGFGLSILEDETMLVIGAVGSFYWQGQLIVQDIEDKLNILETTEAVKTYDNNNRGYSVTVGDFNSDGITDIATSAPRSNDYHGSVQLFERRTTSLFNYANVTAEGQLGEFFGLSLTADDFDGDGRDDLVIGAPFYTDDQTRTYETGRIFVFLQTANAIEPFAGYKIISGPKEAGSRFGYSVSTAGDLNDDGFNDLAVGAPYGGREGRGAVYIFQGYAQGVKTDYSQVIEAAALGNTLRSLGFSLAGGMDQDNNFYPDLLVGAQESAEAVLFRARPVVQVYPSFSTSVENVNLERQTCTLDGEPVNCYNLTTCITFTGKGTPDTLYFDAVWILDNQKRMQDARVFFHNGTRRHRTVERQIRNPRDSQNCHSFTVYVKDDFRDKLNPIWTNFNVSLLQDFSPTLTVPPILDVFRPRNHQSKIEIMKMCGEDEICIPDLSLEVSSPQSEYVYGTRREIELVVTVTNTGEGAYESMLYIDLPEGVTYINVYQRDLRQQVACTAFTHEGSDAQTTVCDVGNPLGRDQSVTFTIRAYPENTARDLRSLLFACNVNSTNAENSTDTDDNYATFEMALSAEIGLYVQGLSVPGQVLFNSSVVMETIANLSDIGPEFTHRYVITNRGTSSLTEMVTEIFWPEFLAENSLIFYLTDVPAVVEGSGHCETDIIPLENVTNYIHENDEEKGVLETFLMSLFREKSEDEEKIYKVGCATELQRPYCKYVRCTTGAMETGDNIVIETTGRVFTQSMAEIVKLYKGVNATSYAQAHVTSTPYSVQPRVDNITVQVETFVSSTDLGANQPLQWWIITLAIVGGVILLLVLIVMLWKCGFFKRRKVEDKKKLTEEEEEEDEDVGEEAPSNGKRKSSSTPQVRVDPESKELYRAIPDDSY